MISPETKHDLPDIALLPRDSTSQDIASLRDYEGWRPSAFRLPESVPRRSATVHAANWLGADVELLANCTPHLASGKRGCCCCQEPRESNGNCTDQSR